MPQSFQKDGNEGCRYLLCDLVGYEELGKREAEHRDGIGEKYLIVHFHHTPCRRVAIISPPLFYGNLHYFVEIPLTLPQQCKETAIESPRSMNLMTVLSLGRETTDITPKMSTLKVRQLVGSASFHLLNRQQNGPEGEKWSETVLTACSIHLAVIRQTLSQDSAPPLRFQYSPRAPSTVPCKNHHKDRKWMLRKQETKKRSVFQQVIK